VTYHHLWVMSSFVKFPFPRTIGKPERLSSGPIGKLPDVSVAEAEWGLHALWTKHKLAEIKANGEPMWDRMQGLLPRDDGLNMSSQRLKPWYEFGSRTHSSIKAESGTDSATLGVADDSEALGLCSRPLVPPLDACQPQSTPYKIGLCCSGYGISIDELGTMRGL
jgi:hypothetical protein